MTAPRKIRLGLFIYTPMIGGAELYFKDLLWNLDREQFTVTLFCEPWDEFVSYLDLPHCPPVTICTIKMREVGGHYGAKELTDGAAPKQLRWSEKKLLRAITAQKKLRSPLLKIPGRIVRAFMHYGFMVSNTARLFAAFRKNPIDVLHVINGGYPGAQSAQLAAFVAKRAGCQRALMSVCNTPVPYHFPKTYERLLDRLVRRYFDAVIIAGDFIGKLLIDLRGFDRTLLKKIPEGVASPEEYGAALYGAPTQGQRLENPTIAMVAGFLPHKGHRFLLEALALLRSEFPSTRATLIGDGPILGETRELANRLGVSDAVIFEGFRPLKEMLQIVNTADMLVHPSLMEGMPYVILHAMSLGKPVIATPVGSIPEVVLHEKTGFIIPVNNSVALANAIRGLLTNANRAKEMGTAGKKRYDENFTITVMVQRHTDLYKTLYQSNPRR
ncbi:glycosyltransferase family 4 protein [Candidatus Uhrbacteria bacterium]|nr:glycosyltransferase family 4 protein [Candidatus Uhrbacteria bacterium]